VARIPSSSSGLPVPPPASATVPKPASALPLPSPASIATPTSASGAKPNWCGGDHLRPDEVTICATESLWPYDNRLRDAYKNVKDKSTDLKALEDDENKWMRNVRGPCLTTQSCIVRVYLDRIAYLNASLGKQ
jgi:uncharacterized protein